MIFSSPTFLFFFLPLTLLATCFAPRPYKNTVLLIVSLFFYFWGEGLFTALLLVSILLNSVIGRLLDSQDSGRKLLVVAGVMLNLLPLFVLKYLSFFAAGINSIFDWPVIPPDSLAPVHLPAGISFFTFQAISYLVDVYRKVVPAEQKTVNAGLYIALFPQLIAGPIVRYHDIAEQLKTRVVTRQGFALGIERFIFGLGKKVLLADPLGAMADKMFNLPASALTAPDAWIGAVSFSLQIYYDFSGYSDMAIGLAGMFGFKLPENFNYPYISRSIKEFWRRWHISLSGWLRDYLYIPLGGNRKGAVRTYVNLIVVFLLCGLWHGASWTFIVWGAWHGCFLIVERIIRLPGKLSLLRPFGLMYAFLVVVVGWVIFRSSSLPDAWQYLRTMFAVQPATLPDMYALIAADRKFHVVFLTAVVFSTPLFPEVRRSVPEYVPGNVPPGIRTLYLGGANLMRLTLFGSVFYFSLLTIASQAYHPFLYFQF